MTGMPPRDDKPEEPLFSRFIHNAYILKYRKPIPCSSLRRWGRMFEKAHSRKVRCTYLNGMRISTVFLGIDHGINNRELILFETMVFDKQMNDQWCERCTTWKQALKQHWRAVDEFKNNRR